MKLPIDSRLRSLRAKGSSLRIVLALLNPHNLNTNDGRAGHGFARRRPLAPFGFALTEGHGSRLFLLTATDRNQTVD